MVRSPGGPDLHPGPVGGPFGTAALVALVWVLTEPPFDVPDTGDLVISTGTA